jgi:hypothetical protein
LAPAVQAEMANADKGAKLMYPANAIYTLRPDLAECFMQFDLAGSQKEFIGAQVFPVLDTMKQGGQYGLFELGQLLQKRNTSRAAGGGYARGNFNFNTNTFATSENGFEIVVDDREAAQYRDYFDAEFFGTLLCLDIILRNQEIRIADDLMTTSTFGSGFNAAAAQPWTNQSGATPIEDVMAAKMAFFANTGLWPNVGICSKCTFLRLKDTEEIVDRIKYSGHDDPKQAKITQQAVAESLDIPRLLVSGAAQNTAAEGLAPVIASIWNSDYFLLARVAETEDFKETCLGRIFAWGEDGGEGPVVETYRDEPKRGEAIRARQDTAEQMLYENCGYLITGVNSEDP